VFPMCPNVLVGAGFESFWLGPRLQEIWKVWSYVHISEAHNGYLEVYLNLGLIGVCLVIAILIHGYRRSVTAFWIDPESGGLALAYVLTSVLYGYTEAGFRMTGASWGYLLLAIIYASGISRIYRKGVKAKGAPSESEDWSHRRCPDHGCCGEPLTSAPAEIVIASYLPS